MLYATVCTVSSYHLELGMIPLEFEKQEEAGGSSSCLNYCAERGQPCRIYVSGFSFMSQLRAPGQAFVKVRGGGGGT